MKNKIKFSARLVDHIINAILIFASVFLAFWLNEVRIEKKEVQNTQEAKFAILAEWKINKIIVERWNAYHEEILDKEDSFLENLDTIVLFDLDAIPGLDNGIQREIITSNGLALLDDEGISFDISTRLNINQIYEQQQNVNKATSKIIDDFLGERELLDPTLGRNNYALFYSLLRNLVEQENDLIDRLTKTIEEFGR